MNKKCSKCNKWKLLTEFHKHSGHHMGRCSQCKKCALKAGHIRYLKYWQTEKARITKQRYDNLEQSKIKRKEYDKSKKGKQAHLRTSLKYYYKNKEKNFVMKKIHQAIQKGKLIRFKNCEFCNEIGRIEGHHEDYDKPFNVLWLCRQCHVDLHRNIIRVAHG